jgi:hypothetical protein
LCNFRQPSVTYVPRSWVHIFSSASRSQTPSICVLPLGRDVENSCFINTDFDYIFYIP